MAEKKEKISPYLFWIDLEMTGLNVDQDQIIEIASVITDNNLEIIAEGPSLAIFQPEELMLALMDDWNKNAHSRSGLIDLVKKSQISVAQAAEQTLQFAQRYCAPQSTPICGNSVYVDRAFMRKHMPSLESYFNYRIIDVSSIKEVARRWYPNNPLIDFKKPENHRAFEDTLWAIDELKHYRTHFFTQD